MDHIFPPGNEFSEQSARAIAKAAFEEMKGLESLRLLGTTDTHDGPTRVDLRLDATSCAGSLETDEGGLEIVKNGDGAWVKGDEKFWRSQAGSSQQAQVLASTFRAKWIAVEGKNEFKETCDLAGLLDSFEVDEDDSDQTLEKGEIETIGDREAIAVTGGAGKDRTTAWIAIEAPHLVLKLAPARQGPAREALFFEDFGIEVGAETPPRKDIVRLPRTP